MKDILEFIQEKLIINKDSKLKKHHNNPKSATFYEFVEWLEKEYNFTITDEMNFRSLLSKNSYNIDDFTFELYEKTSFKKKENDEQIEDVLNQINNNDDKNIICVYKAKNINIYLIDMTDKLFGIRMNPFLITSSKYNNLLHTYIMNIKLG